MNRRYGSVSSTAGMLLARCFPWVLCAIMPLVPGCRTHQNIVAMERESRQLEDKIFQQKRDLEECQRKLERAEAKAAKTEADRSDNSPAKPSASDSAYPDDAQPRGFVPPAGLAPPRVDPPDEPLPPGDLPPRWDPPQGNSSTTPPRADEDRLRRVSIAPRLSGRAWPLGRTQVDRSRTIQAIELLDQHTRGYNHDASPGDEGIVVGLRPVDGDGQPVRLACPVSVSLLDPAMPDEDARVARWDLSAEDVARSVGIGDSAECILLKLLWTPNPPSHAQLHVFVRYTTPDGRRIEADAPLRINAPGPSLTMLNARIETPTRVVQAPKRPTWSPNR